MEDNSGIMNKCWETSQLLCMVSVKHIIAIYVEAYLVDLLGKLPSFNQLFKTHFHEKICTSSNMVTKYFLNYVFTVSLKRKGFP